MDTATTGSPLSAREHECYRALAALDPNLPEEEYERRHSELMAELDAVEIARLDARHDTRMREAGLGAAATIARWQTDLLDRLEKAACWHLDRGETRGMQRGAEWHGLDALDGLLSAVLDLAELPADATDEAANAALEAAHEAIWDCKHGSDHDQRHDGGARGAAWLQCREVEESDLRSLLRCWSYLALLRRAVRDGQMPGEQALAFAGDVLFDAPGTLPLPEAC